MEMSSLSSRLPVLLLFPCCRLGGPEQRRHLRAETPRPPIHSWQKPARASNHPAVLLFLTRIPKEFLIPTPRTQTPGHPTQCSYLVWTRSLPSLSRTRV